MSDRPVTARQLAAEAIEDVLYRDAFAAAAVDQKLGESSLDARDRALCTELVYGVLRTHLALEEVLTRFAARGIPDRTLRSHLLVAAYQLLLLDRVPGFAAVDECVTSVKALRGERVAGFANALLRKVAKLDKWSREDALTKSAPAWLLEEITRAVGKEAAVGLFGVGPAGGTAELEHTPQCIRMVGSHRPGPWASHAVPGRIRDEALRFSRAGDLRALAQYASGEFVIQEEGAQFAAACLGVHPGDKVLDVCAGRGQKTTLFVEQLGATASTATLWATDLGAKKLEVLRAELRRLSLPAVTTAKVDWGQDADAPVVGIPDDFDKVLVDAPCSGTGTLRRRPEIALRLRLSDIERLASLSERILRNAARHVRPGGRVLFVVCSVLHRECEAIVERVADLLAPTPLEPDSKGIVPPSATAIRLLPTVHGTDGFFIASFEKRTAAASQPN